ncbi:hypothetical protein OpiT1DRAFT_01508 [Opitutaceae bacterium TAV1]|nr:hypothetical protein OPIT5_19390 [Opitutaceae bacterium TAV5]EIP97080.1 hypothetical protein OpiT1DRAFT_01508 [Opitutaceae bacterium TAV1]
MSESAIHLILFAIAALTLVAGVAALAPRTVFARRLPADTFGAGGWLVLRHWGVLVVICGLLLFWAARDATVRHPLLLAVGAEKLAFGLLVLRRRTTPLGKLLLPGALCDLLACLLFLLCWLAAR